MYTFDIISVKKYLLVVLKYCFDHLYILIQIYKKIDLHETTQDGIKKNYSKRQLACIIINLIYNIPIYFFYEVFTKLFFLIF